MGGGRNWLRIMSREIFNISSDEPCVSATKHLVNWSFKQRLLMKIFVENQCVMSTGPPQTSNF